MDTVVYVSTITPPFQVPLDFAASPFSLPAQDILVYPFSFSFKHIPTTTTTIAVACLLV